MFWLFFANSAKKKKSKIRSQQQQKTRFGRETVCGYEFNHDLESMAAASIFFSLFSYYDPKVWGCKVSLYIYELGGLEGSLDIKKISLSS